MDQIEDDIDNDKKLSKQTFKNLKQLVKKLPFHKKTTQKNMEKINQSKVIQLKEKKELKILMLN